METSARIGSGLHGRAESGRTDAAQRAPPRRPIETKGKLQRLLKEHHQIAEEIMDVRDWAMED